MSKFTSLVLVVAFALSLISTAAQAQVAAAGRAVGPTGPGSDICVAACGAPVEALILPPAPRDCGAPGHGPLVAAAAVPRRDCVSTSIKACGDQLSQLRRVTVGRVQRIEDEKVHLVPLCDTLHQSLTQAEVTVLSRGNVGGLVSAIGANETLMAALDDDGYSVDDVIGIAVAPDNATLYVSKRH